MAAPKNVYELAQERLDVIFREFDTICVSFSGGKDSGVLLNLCIDYIRRNRLNRIGRGAGAEQQRRARGDGRDAEQQKNATAVDADHRRSADLRGNGRDKDRQNAIDDQRGRAAEAENEAQKPHRPVLLLRFGGRGIRHTVF